MKFNKHVPWKNLSFCFISVVWVYFSHKTSILRVMEILLIKKMMSDTIMSCQTVSDLV